MGFFPCSFFFFLSLWNSKVDESSEKGKPGFVSSCVFQAGCFQGCTAVLGRGWRCSRGASQGWGGVEWSLRTAETCVRTAGNTQCIHGKWWRHQRPGWWPGQQPLPAIFSHPEPSPPLRSHPKVSWFLQPFLLTGNKARASARPQKKSLLVFPGSPKIPEIIPKITPKMTKIIPEIPPKKSPKCPK